MSTVLGILIIIAFLVLDFFLIRGLVRQIIERKRKKKEAIELAQDLVDINNDKKEV